MVVPQMTWALFKINLRMTVSASSSDLSIVSRSVRCQGVKSDLFERLF